MRQNISAPAISRIISNNTNIKKAPTGNTWGRGYIVTGYGVEVGVTYQDTDRGVVKRNLDAIVELINGREDQKYIARKVRNKEYGGLFVKVEIRTDEDKADELREKAAEESPYAVTQREVGAVLRQKGDLFEYTAMGAGFFVERAEAPDDRMVRVSYRDHAHTTYAKEIIGGREAHSKARVLWYANKLREAGYAVQVEGDHESVLVGVAGEFGGESQEEAAQAAKQPLLDLREAVEADDVAYMTRKAGPTSIFVYFLVPFRDKLRRCEVFWSGGVYKLSPRFGGPMREFYNLPFLVEEIGKELDR